MTRENALRHTESGANGIASVSPETGENTATTRESASGATKATIKGVNSLAHGWIVSCPKCGKNRLVYREQILSGSWIKCPHCGPDEPEAAS